MGLSIAALIRAVKSFVPHGKHAALEQLLQSCMGRRVDKQQLKLELVEIAGRDAVRRALEALVPAIRELARRAPT